MIDNYYAFVFKGLLTEDALDKAGRKSKNHFTEEEGKRISATLGITEMDNDLVIKSMKMAIVYTAIAAFENSVRSFIEKKLLEEIGENWWITTVDEGIRKKAEGRMEEEKKIRWHTPRGDRPINYTEMKHLTDTIRKNWKQFEPHLISIEWAANILDTVERSRNVIMHSGELGNRDIERVGSHIKDWIRQVGA
ncbi:MAG TPA: Swt1 family HEPN domain-containing protein [Chitinophagaceae bacterium]|nr:Swt1 family HEPN domain-containing protein [Chitinophagaceae bacterium]